MIGILRSAARYTRWLLLVVVGAGTIVASTHTARSEDIGFISKLGEFEKAGGHVSDYKVNQEDHLLDLSIVPTTPLTGGEAGSIGRDTCSLGRRTATNLTHAWTVRAFVPGEAAPAYTCEIPAIEIPAIPSTHKRHKRPSAVTGVRRASARVVRVRRAPQTAATHEATLGRSGAERPPANVPRRAHRR
jgi:hypothetical protein